MASAIQSGNVGIKASLVGSLDNLGSMAGEVNQNLVPVPAPGLPRPVYRFAPVRCMME